MVKRLRVARHYEDTEKKLKVIKKKYNLTTPQIIEIVIERIASVEEMDNLFGFKVKFRRRK